MVFVYANRICSRRCSKSIGPTAIILRFAGSYVFDEEGSFTLSLAAGRAGGFVLAVSFIRELAVVATETGCRGRELLRGGESLGGAADTYAWSRLLLLLGVTKPDGGCFRGVWVGVFARVVGGFALACLLLLRTFVGGLRSVEGEFDREEVGLESLGVANLLLIETGNLELAPAGVWEAGGGGAAASAAATAVAVAVAAASAAIFVVGDAGDLWCINGSMDISLRDRA